MTMTDSEWQRMVTSGTTSDNEWYNQGQRMATSDKEWQRVVISAKFIFLRKERNLSLGILRRTL